MMINQLNWRRIILTSLISFALVVAGTSAGYWYGTQQVRQLGEATPTASQPTTILTPTPDPSLEEALRVAENIRSKLEPTTEACGGTRPSPDTDGWLEYHNNRFNYSLKYPKDKFTVREFNECSLIQFFKSFSPSEPETSSTYEYYLDIMAIRTQGNLDAHGWLSSYLQDIFNFPDIASRLKERQVSVGDVQGIELGQLPVQINENVVVVPTEDVLIYITMYPAPTEPGSTGLPEGFWNESQKAFPTTFYQILSTFKFLD